MANIMVHVEAIAILVVLFITLQPPETPEYFSRLESQTGTDTCQPRLQQSCLNY